MTANKLNFVLVLVVFITQTFDFTQSFAFPKTGDQIPKNCPPGYELQHDRKTNKYECTCKKYHLYWPLDGLCYREFQQGPCSDGHRLVLDEVSRKPTCTCPFFSAKHTDGKCYKEYTQGPCPSGKLMVLDKGTGFGTCSCDSNLRMYYHEPTGQCFELYKQGPCPEGHILAFDYGNLEPQCKCKDGFHLHIDGKCYRLNTGGPCGHELQSCPGTPCFMRSLEALDVQCTCLPKIATTEDGHCYQPYTRGPCELGEWLVFKSDGSARCENKKYCKRFDNWHWWSPHQRCYRQFSQGPCKKGKLFYLDTDIGGTGCYCKPDWNVYYWKETQECFEQESPGPCPTGQYFAYNSTSRSTECNCFKNFVYDPTKGTCLEQFTRGPCPDGQLVVQDEQGRLKCDCGPHMKSHYWREEGGRNLCYPHFEQGPCAPGEQFRAHPKNLEPACVIWGKTSQFDSKLATYQ